jgi:Domain of unknown function (DUF397)
VKSTFSGTNGNCVDIMHDTINDQILVTDTKTYGQINPPCLVFTRAEWTAFLEGVRDGQFDFLTECPGCTNGLEVIGDDVRDCSVCKGSGRVPVGTK